MQTPKFIVSFDCEGKWGMADRLTPEHHKMLTNEKLTEAYRRLVLLLDRYGIAATFAFVGTFTLTREEFSDFSEEYFQAPPALAQWLRPFASAVRSGNTEGWLVPECLEVVRRNPTHEIGSHGCTHVPLGTPLISRDEFRWEMQYLRAVAARKSLTPRTLIYPRNLVGYTDELLEAGFVGYRSALRARPGRRARVASLLREGNIFDVSQDPSLEEDTDGVISIPSGYFLNWRAGLRKKIPVRVSVKRWAHLREHALATGGVVHLWSHPHNFLDGDRQWELFDRILAEFAPAIRSGQMENPTQEQYCAGVRAGRSQPPKRAAA